MEIRTPSNDSESSRKKVEIINDFEFPKSCETISFSSDGQYILTSGTYPPQIAIFDLSELSLKHRRGIDYHVIKSQFLTPDYRKLVLLCDNRYIEFHNQAGRYYSFRVPKQARDMAYLSENANLYLVGSSNSIYRMDLSLGKFNVPLESSFEEINSISINKSVPIFTIAGNDGFIETWDYRSDRIASKIHISDEDITCCKYSNNGMKIAFGDAIGTLRVYDIRSQNPLWERSDLNNFSINTIEWIGFEDQNLAWSSSKSIKISKSELFENIATIESSFIINRKASYTTIPQLSSFTFYPNSGLCFIASDQSKIASFYIPSIGPSPKWCSFLENVTEELYLPITEVIKTDNVTIGNSIFITQEQLELWSAKELLETDMVKPYLHGYLIDKPLYKKLKNAFDEFTFEEYKRKKANEKFEEKIKKSMRIPANNIKKINQDYARQLIEKSELVEVEGSKKKTKAMEAAMRARQVLEDDRFSRLFTDEDFLINPEEVNGK